MLNLSSKRIIVGLCLLPILALVGCGGSTTGTAAPTASTSTPPQEISGKATAVTLTPTLGTQAGATSVVATPRTTPATGPQVILTPTLVPGGSGNSEQVTLPDRTLIIQNVGKQQGNGANSTAVSLQLTMNNTGTKSIPNQASYYQLIGTEGDVFGYQSSATPGFFGTITGNNSRSGTIVFQVPTAAVSGLRLLFRPELGTETVYVRLTIH